MATICLYQDSRHEKPLHWMRDVFGIGYLSRRSDGITELRINGYTHVLKVLTELRPFIRFKEVQADALIEACRILSTMPIQKLSEKQLKRVVDLAFIVKNENYKSRSTHTKEAVYKRLGLTP